MEIGKYYSAAQLIKHSLHPSVPQQLGNEVVIGVKVGLVFSGGNQGADRTGVREELGDLRPLPCQTPSKVNCINF